MIEKVQNFNPRLANKMTTKHGRRKYTLWPAKFANWIELERLEVVLCSLMQSAAYRSDHAGLQLYTLLAILRPWSRFGEIELCGIALRWRSLVRLAMERQIYFEAMDSCQKFFKISFSLFLFFGLKLHLAAFLDKDFKAMDSCPTTVNSPRKAPQLSVSCTPFGYPLMWQQPILT